MMNDKTALYLVTLKTMMVTSYVVAVLTRLWVNL